MNKNNLDNLKLKKTHILPKDGKKKIGRPMTDKGQKESETIALKITIKEYQAIKNKADLVPLGTYIKHYIRTQTDLFNSAHN